MKLYYLLICLILIGCKTTDITSFKQLCDESGICSQEIQKNQSIEIKSDSIGALYYTTSPNDKTLVITYKFEKNRDPKFVDNHYNEEVIFELNIEDLQSSFKDKTSVKSLFRVFCYCKGKAGYYQINSTISFDKSKNSLQVYIPNVVENQIIQSFIIDLNKKA